MDVLYYVGSGSRHNNQELRYSLRSLDKHCKDVDRVFIVGNKPSFIVNCECIWVADGDKWYENAFKKTRAAIDAGISEEFLLMNDDFYMMQDFEAKNYPFFHRGDMMKEPKNEYQKIIVNTRRYLEGLGKPIKHYGVHCPIRIEAEKYKQLEPFYHKPMSARCLYGNLFCKGIKVDDCKGTEIKKSKTKCFSSADWVGREIFDELQKLFPNPSRWEEENA